MKCYFVKSLHIEKQLSKLRELKECSSAINPLSIEKKFCKDHFVKNTERDMDGKLIVSIPFKDDSNKLGYSKQVVERRFLSLERKLNKQPDLREQYCALIK